MPSRTLLCGALLFASHVLSGCVRQNAAPPVRTDSLVIAQQQEPIALDPLLLEGPMAYTVGDLLYTYLTNYDSNGNAVPDVALQVPTLENGGVSRDGLRVTYHLRHGVRWQDGAPLTSADVVFSYKAVMNPANVIPSRFGYDRIASVTAPDPYTVVVTLKTPYSPIVVLFFGGDSNYPIVPAHSLAKYPDVNRVPFNTAPVASGPYVLEDWSHGDRLRFRANASYYGGKPAIDRLELPFVHDPSTIVNELQTGEIDAAFSLDASRIALLRSLPGKRVVVTPIPYFYAMSYNMGDPILSDVRVRRALALAIDRDTIVRKASHGVYNPETGMRGAFTWAYDPGADTMRYDPRAAARLLDAAGWRLGADGKRAKNGKRLQLQLSFPAGSDITTELATQIAAAEAAAGVDVSLKRYNRDVYMVTDGPILQGRYQLQLYDYHSDYDPDVSWMLACNQRGPAGFNVSRYCNPEVDRLLNVGVASFERSVRRRAYVQVQRDVQRDMPLFFLAQASEIDVLPTALRNFDRPLLSPFGSVARWQVTPGSSPKKRRR